MVRFYSPSASDRVPFPSEMAGYDTMQASSVAHKQFVSKKAEGCRAPVSDSSVLSDYSSLETAAHDLMQAVDSLSHKTDGCGAHVSPPDVVSDLAPI